MATLSISDIKRLTAPFSSKADQAAAEDYWRERPVAERREANKELLREFYRLRGIDMDQPVERTIRRVTLEEMNQQHEEWHRSFEQFLAEK